MIFLEHQTISIYWQFRLNAFSQAIPSPATDHFQYAIVEGKPMKWNQRALEMKYAIISLQSWKMIMYMSATHFPIYEYDFILLTVMPIGLKFPSTQFGSP